MTKKVQYQGVEVMERYRCVFCGWVYDPENGDLVAGIKSGTDFRDIPETYRCPVCGASKEDFKPVTD